MKICLHGHNIIKTGYNHYSLISNTKQNRSFTANSTRNMNIHEYQGKAILKSFGVRVQEGIVADTVEQAVEAAKKLKDEYNSSWVVVKAQIHAGGRGKGGGVKVAKSLDEVHEYAQKILGMTLVTHQTGAAGRVVKRLLVEEGADIRKELYVGMVVDRASQCVS